MLVPLLLVLFVCVPVTLVVSWLVAASRVGQLLGAPARGSLSLVEYARVLVGLRPRPVADSEWDEFAALLSEVAAGRVHPWERLGPVASPEPPYESRFALPSPPVLSRVRVPFLRGSSSPVLPAVFIVVSVFMSLMLLSTLSSMFSGGPRSNASLLVGSQIVPQAAWVPTGQVTAQASVPETSMPSVEAGLDAAGFDGGCTALSVPQERPVQVNPRQPPGLSRLCEASDGRFAFEAYKRGDGMVLLRVTERSSL